MILTTNENGLSVRTFNCAEAIREGSLYSVRVTELAVRCHPPVCNVSVLEGTNVIFTSEEQECTRECYDKGPNNLHYRYYQAIAVRSFIQAADQGLIPVEACVALLF